MPKLQVSTDKTLRLNNALIYQIDLNDKALNLERTVELMENYILSKAGKAVGPLIQYTEVSVNENGETSTRVKLMRQCTTFFHKLDSGYKMESVLRIKNCMYCRFTGNEANLSIAYDKVRVEAYEREFQLAGCAYTVYVEEQEEADTITADIFMPYQE